MSVERLARELGRLPSVPELAVAIGERCEQIVESLDAMPGDTAPWFELPEPDGAPASCRCGESGTAAPNRAALAVVFALLESRAKRVLLMRFLRGMSHAQIAAELDVSPEQVSRLQDQSLSRLNAARINPLSDPADASDTAPAGGSNEIMAQPARRAPGLLTA